MSLTPSPDGQFVPPHLGDVYLYEYGECNWYVQQRYPLVPFTLLGLPKDWPRRAYLLHIATGTTPRVGAIVVFQPDVEGADATGHVAIVETVYSWGSFLISEMNFLNGFAHTDERFAYTWPGVSFLYL